MDRDVLTKLLIGLVAWIALQLFGQNGGWWITPPSILLFGLLVIAPLAFALAETRAHSPGHLYRTGQYLQLFAALITSAAYLIPAGVLAATFAIAWVPVSGLLMIGRLRNGVHRRAEEAAISAGFIFLAISTFFLWSERMGIVIIGSTPSDALSLSIHLFYAGFGGLLLTGLVGRKIREVAAYTPPAVKIVILLQLALAASFFVPSADRPTLKATVLLLQIAGQVPLAWLLLTELRQSIQKPSARRMGYTAITSLAISSATLLLAAAGLVSKFFYLPAPVMMTAHGWLTAVGFIGGGLLVFTFENEA